MQDSTAKQCVSICTITGGSKPPPYGIYVEMLVGRGLVAAKTYSWLEKESLLFLQRLLLPGTVIV